MDLVAYLKGSYGSYGSNCDPPSLDFEIGGRGSHSAIVSLNVFFCCGRLVEAVDVH